MPVNTFFKAPFELAWSIFSSRDENSSLHLCIKKTSCYIEQVSLERRTTKTKIITLANHKTGRQSNEPIRTQSNYTSPAPSAGKRVRILVLILLLIE